MEFGLHPRLLPLCLLSYRLWQFQQLILLRFAQRLRVFRPNQQIYIIFKCLNMSINDLIVPSTNIVACFLSAYYNIQGPHLPPKTNYTKAALASTKFKMDTEFTHTPANASSADYQNRSSLVLIPPDQTSQYITEKP